MANYLKGIGDTATRANEILPSLDARINNFLCGHAAGIIKGEFYDFKAEPIDRGIIVKSGLMQAHGYFACSDADTQINFVMPASTQYVQIYAEIDLSVVPNRFSVKATPLSNSTAWTPQQDNLRSTTNGRYQLHLWQVTITASTIILTDKRAYISKPLNAVNAESGVTQDQSDNSNRVATTSYVRRAVSDAFNIMSADLKKGGTKVGTIYRQGNFVYFSTGYVSMSNGSATLDAMPEEFRPKSSISVGVCGSWFTLNSYANWAASISASGTASPSGTISARMSETDHGANDYVRASYCFIYGGWEITA